MKTLNDCNEVAIQKRSASISVLMIASLLLLPLQPAFADSQNRDPIAGTPQQRVGFYQGAFLMSIHQGSFSEVQGGLIRHDQEIHQSLVRQDHIGTVMLDGGGGYVRMGPGAFIDPIYSGGQSLQLDFEYGLFSFLGLGLSVQSLEFNVTRQEQFPSPQSFEAILADPAASLDPIFYTEVVPVTRNYYSEHIVTVDLTLHPLPETKLDPYLIARVGGGRSKTAYRDGKPTLLDLFRANSKGETFAFSGGVGVNYYLNGEFGFKFEINKNQRRIWNPEFTGDLDMVSVSAGIHYNWDNILKPY